MAYRNHPAIQPAQRTASLPFDDSPGRPLSPISPYGQVQHARPQQQPYGLFPSGPATPEWNSGGSVPLHQRYRTNSNNSSPAYPHTPDHPRSVSGNGVRIPGAALAGKYVSPGNTRSPQVIRCSDCMLLVPVVELGDHSCKPISSAAVVPESRTRLPSNNSEGSNEDGRRGNAHKLRINVSQAQSVAHQQPLGTPYHATQPKTSHPSSAVDVKRSNGLSPMTGHRPNVPYSAPLAAENEMQSQQSMPRSFSSRTGISTLANANNAGIGAGSPDSSVPLSASSKLPFFERYQRQYGTTAAASASVSSRDGSISPAAPSIGSISPGLPISPGWSSQPANSTLKEHSPPTRPTLPHQTSGGQTRAQQAYIRYGYEQREASREREHEQHRRFVSGSEQSSRSSSSNSSPESCPGSSRDEGAHEHASATMQYLEPNTPETSPDFPDTPVFARDRDHNKSLHGRHGQSRDASNEAESQRDAEASEAEAEDFIDSYPTPQPAYIGRFGGLVLDETQLSRGTENAAQQSANVPQGRVRSNALQTERAPAMATRGLAASQSTPGNLSALLGGAHCTEPVRQRSQTHDVHENSSTSQRSKVHRPDDAGNGLDSCLNDLLKELNRDSYQAPSIANSSFKHLEKSPLPHNVGFSPSDSTSSLCYANESSSTTSLLLESPTLTQDQAFSKPRECSSCSASLSHLAKQIKRDEHTYCTSCYAQLYLPKCRKCQSPIEGKAIGSGDGKVKGKYHPACFSCFDCSAPFPGGDFYVFEEQPYCAKHYHQRNGTLCANLACTQEGIEGPCVSLVGEENGNGGRYHPSCFSCTDASCSILLDQYHYVLNGLPYCETHARDAEERESWTQASASELYTAPAANRLRDHQPPAIGISALRQRAPSPTYGMHNLSQQAHPGSSYERFKGTTQPQQSAGRSDTITRRAMKRRTVVQRI